MSKKKTLKKYRIKYGLEKGKKKTLPKKMTTYNQYNSRSKNPKPSLDIETLDNGVRTSETYYDILMEEKRKWESCETK